MKSLFILFLSSFSYAQVLLVPSADRGFETYKTNCEKPGYLCTTSFFLEQAQKQATPQFDLLIDEIDYSAKEFRENLPDRILKVLKSEMISIDQVEILLKLIEQTQIFMDAKKLKTLQAIEKQLQENRSWVQAEESKELPSEFIIVFKKALPLKDLRKFQTSFLKPKLDSVTFNRATSSTEYLAIGDCKSEVMHSSIQNLKWQMDREHTCDFADQFSQVSSSTSNFVSNNKTTLITVGLVAIGAALLLNNYEFEVSF